MVFRPANRVPLAHAATLAGNRASTLHLVVAATRPPVPWTLFAGCLAVTPRHGLVDEVLDQLMARGIHVEVHRTSGRTSRLAVAIASTVGGDLVA